MSETGSACWVILPVGQQVSGNWIDHLLSEGAKKEWKRAAPDPEPGIRTRVEVFRGEDSEERINEQFYLRGWTDGLPIVVPTLFRVREMLRCSPISRATILGEMEPLRGQVSVEKIAANAVMAGCLPEYFPVVLQAVCGLLDPAFNMRGVQTTDENVAPLLIVSGPVAESIDLNSGLGALGPGWRANATIGRALRLVMINLGGGWAGIVGLAGIGQPGRYTMCLGERRQPGWPLLHEEAGLTATHSAVTLLRAECAINVTGGLDDIADVMRSATSAFSILNGGYCAVLLAPYTAAQLSADGWTKSDVARYLFDHSQIPVAQWRKWWLAREIVPTYGLPQWALKAEKTGLIPIVESSAFITVFVAGGDAPIAQHVYFPTWGFPACKLTLPISFPS